MSKVATSTPSDISTEFSAMLGTLQQFRGRFDDDAIQFDASQLRKLDAAAMALMVAINMKRLGTKTVHPVSNTPRKQPHEC